MRHQRTLLVKILCLLVVVSLLPGLAVSAAPSVHTNGSLCKPAKQASDSAAKPVVMPMYSCCVGKISSTSVASKAGGSSPSVSLCCLPLKVGSLAHSKPLAVPDPCAPPDGSCGIPYTVDAVVGDLPFSTQAYWAPGKPALDVTINAGTYWVQGVATAENGDEFYQIIDGCQKLYVPVGLMQPSYQAPWNGEALPTTPVEL